MELRQIEFVLTVAEECHLTRVADAIDARKPLTDTHLYTIRNLVLDNHHRHSHRDRAR